MNVFHHVIEIGGTIYNNNVEFGFIQGVDSDLSTPMTPDTTTLLETPEGTAVAIPTVTNLLAVKSIDDINALTNGTTTTYKPRHFIPITPFLCQTVSEAIEKNEGDCKSLLLAVVLAIKQFDTEFDGNADYTNKAKQKCKDILYWLYLSSKADSPVKSIPTTVSKSRRIRDKLIEVTSTCIKGNTTSNTTTGTAEFANAIGNHLKRPLEIIATSNTTQSDILRSFQVQHERNNDKSSRSFTKLPSQYQNMILVASSQGEVTAMELNDQAKAFFKCSNHLSANVMLNYLLETKQVDCSISTAMTQALMCGCF